MALVKCTKDTKTHVQQQIDSLFKDRINKAYELRSMTEQQIAEEVYSRVHTPTRIKVLREMEADISPAYHVLTSNNEFVFDAHPAEGIERRITGKFSSSQPVLPSFTSSYHSPDVKVFSDAAKQSMIEASARRHAVVKERDEFKNQFNKAYDQVRSINELIKVWPAVIELLPPGTMDRVNRKNGPRASAVEIDTAALSVQLLKAKVAK